MQFKNAIIALTLALGLTTTAFAEELAGISVKKGPLPPAATMGFNQRFDANGEPVAGKPGELRSLIEFRNSRGFAEGTFRDINDKVVSLSQFKDKLVLVDVWATWCEPCLRTVPAMTKLQQHFNKEGSDVRVVSIALDLKGARIKKFKKINKFDEFESWFDPEKNIQEALPLDVIPSFFILDGKGHTVAFVRGFVDWSSPEIIPYLEELAKKYAKRS